MKAKLLFAGALALIFLAARAILLQRELEIKSLLSCLRAKAAKRRVYDHRRDRRSDGKSIFDTLRR